MSKIINSLIRLVFVGFLMAFVFLHDKLGIQFDYPMYPYADNIYIRWAKISLFFLALYDLLRIYYYGVIKNPKAPGWLGNVSSAVVGLVVLFVVLETAFMFIAQSHEGALTLASHIWFERYWPPITNEGYRDSPPTDTLGKKKKVLVVGDSFTSGHGLKDVNERYSNVLAQKLGKEYTVYNLGISGSDTRDEYKRLMAYDKKPDLLVLQYFPNDIEKVAAELGDVPKAMPPFSDLPGPLRSLFMRSYLLNYIYWQFPHGNPEAFQGYAKKVYGDSTIINKHLSDLGKFVAVRDSLRIPMYVVLFPFSHNLEKTMEYTRPVVAFFKQRNVPVLEVRTIVTDIKPDDRIVGRNDFHASAVVNKRVGDALYNLIRANPTPQAPK